MERAPVRPGAAGGARRNSHAPQHLHWLLLRYKFTTIEALASLCNVRQWRSWYAHLASRKPHDLRDIVPEGGASWHYICRLDLLLANQSAGWRHLWAAEWSLGRESGHQIMPDHILRYIHVRVTCFLAKRILELSRKFQSHDSITGGVTSWLTLLWNSDYGRVYWQYHFATASATLWCTQHAPHRCWRWLHQVRSPSPLVLMFILLT